MLSSLSPVLVIAPHCDDAELGCGGTIARLLGMGAKVTIATLTDRDANLPQSAIDRTPTHMEEAGKVLANESDGLRLVHYQFPLYEFLTVRQKILREFERLREMVNPKCILATHGRDINQDHSVAMEEARRVFRGRTLLSYQILRSTYVFNPQVFVELTREQLDRKIASVQCYSTQSAKYYCRPEVIEANARIRGAMAECEYAEAFEVEWIRL